MSVSSPGDDVEASAGGSIGYLGAVSIGVGGMLIFVAYEGFELIANSAHDVRDPAKNIPRAAVDRSGRYVGDIDASSKLPFSS